MTADITTLRAQAAQVVAQLRTGALQRMANKHMRSVAWVRRFLRHNAYWRPTAVLRAAKGHTAS